MLRQVASALRNDRALSLGLLGGTLVSMAGLTGYIGVPFLTGEEQYLVYAAMGAGFDMPGYPLWYHGAVLVLPSFVVSLSGTLLVRRWRPTGNTAVLKFFGGVVGVPLVVILIAYLVTAVSFGVMSAVGVIEENPLLGVGIVFVFTMFALVFGIFAVVFATSIGFIGVGLGATGGYLLARGLIRVSKNQQAER